MIKKIWFILCLSLLVNAKAFANNINLLGVSLAQQLVLPQNKEQLSLNGYGAVEMWGEKAYVGALYTQHAEKRAELLLINNDPLAMIFYFVKDDISSQMISKAIIEGIIVNSGGWDKKSLDKSRLLALKEAIEQDFHAGDVLAFYYSPKNGLWMYVNNQEQRHWPHGKSLINMLLRMWIGPHPPTRDFKHAILSFPVGT
ncbi:MAG: chalcone isomerase family protein [Proteobacteria bacterium]|nr:chalcone isomerase family protein [Pseudomonadota bacterium]